MSGSGYRMCLALAILSLISVRAASQQIAQNASFPVTLPFDPAFLEAALQRFRASGVSQKELAGIESTHRQWLMTQKQSDSRPPSPGQLVATYGEVHQLAVRTSVKSEVPFRTAKPDARVMYEPVDERGKPGRRPQPSANLTNATEWMDIGVYYIWTERSGRATSDMNFSRTIVKLKEDPITLVEDR